jgi:hypothetical protein
MRSAAKAGKQTNAEQGPNPPSIPMLAGAETDMAIDRTEAVKTPSKPIPARNTMSSRKRKRFDAASCPWTEERPTAEAAAEQKRISGRNLIPWQREFHFFYGIMDLILTDSQAPVWWRSFFSTWNMNALVKALLFPGMILPIVSIQARLRLECSSTSLVSDQSWRLKAI